MTALYRTTHTVSPPVWLIASTLGWVILEGYTVEQGQSSVQDVYKRQK